MRAGGSLTFAIGPLVAFAAVGVLTLLLRWAFGHHRSLVARRPMAGSPSDYGLLQAVATPSTFAEAEVVRRHLEAAGIRATIAPTTAGPAVLVFPDDAPAARLALRGFHPPTTGAS